ncbi:50S ribosomal protein L9 [Frankia sp. Mgl5]|uniref:Large ribosomal subunit protein bL9 n=2 Tax=Parafrankia TaxID=2994362 RepID=RL9_PARS2|nr:MULTISPECIES: 50S ribosomal protein L9 [Frankiaceae]A8L8T1.1 RecName: Full=Large ribosomal subunit protein bL9; AltName: Full=50S ribosomal protein L9 [Frankia sp. EAN1pec]CAI7974013.1 50S ribosomal protein L9 [Frankia sp. Hr75.2]ABW16628.1 ribosomal protein L9 [Frankia sp. EAN1pec]MCK9927829.1 50S ribosomal protein L9 [Frankia sp. Mgl5]OHV27323.1 50S ribosomal protein L9 [Parafrankia soli]TCJ35405.1 50S ribosomal protein L9 [Parafrankia sp. BMG5.11]
MKLVLTQEVPGLGSPGDIVDVADGYGRNYLVPRRYAILATRGAERQVAQIKRARDARAVRDLDHAKEIAGQLSGLSVRLVSRAGKEGRLFGSVTAADVVSAVTDAGGPALDRRRVELSTPIKSLGSHTVAVHLHPEVSAKLTVQVTSA